MAQEEWTTEDEQVSAQGQAHAQGNYQLRDPKCAKILEMQKIMECIIGKSLVRKQRDRAEKRVWRTDW